MEVKTEQRVITVAWSLCPTCPTRRQNYHTAGETAGGFEPATQAEAGQRGRAEGQHRGAERGGGGKSSLGEKTLPGQLEEARTVGADHSESDQR